VDVPDPQYVKTRDGAYIAYQVVGEGPVDIAWQFEFGGAIDIWQESRAYRWWFEGLSALGRLILHDSRATGLSSRSVSPPNLETRMSDLQAVLDAAGSERVVMGAWAESLSPCLLLAASDPARVRALIWWGPAPRTVWAPDYPWGDDAEEVGRQRAAFTKWGTIEYARAIADAVERYNSMRMPEDEVRWMARWSRHACTPDVAVELSEIWWQTDIRPVLSTIRTPTLLIAEEGSGRNPPVAEYVVEQMPNAVIEIIPRSVGWPRDKAEADLIYGPPLQAIQRFVGVPSKRPIADAILATVLFTDIVASTEHQLRLGDHGWKDLVERHHMIVRGLLDDWRGVENDTAGDGFYATFDGPARAIHCAIEIRDRVHELDIEIRAGIHTGECELIDGKHAGIAVTTGARISALAEPSQVLVSQTVKDLVAGSDFTFEPAGEHELKGVPDRWRLFSAS
jgi:class 3 adenylate cyclase/pimeloyl-ACP methyl ester carboxylesterase